MSCILDDVILKVIETEYKKKFVYEYVNNSKLLLFIAAILEHVLRNRTCSIGKLRTHNKKRNPEPWKTPVPNQALSPTQQICT